MIGLHGFAQAAVTVACLWVVGVAVMGMRTRALPIVLCAIALIPAFRLLGVLGPLGVLDGLPEAAWFLFMISVPGLLLWCLLLGIVLLGRALASNKADRAVAATAAP